MKFSIDLNLILVVLSAVIFFYSGVNFKTWEVQTVERIIENKIATSFAKEKRDIQKIQLGNIQRDKVIVTLWQSERKHLSEEGIHKKKKGFRKRNEQRNR